MQIISVDFSLNSPGIVILTEENLKFISYLKAGSGTKAELKIQEELSLCDDITLHIQPGFETSKEFSEKEMSKLYRYIKIADDIIFLIETLELIDPSKDIVIAFEGVSYGSGGGGTNNLIDLAAGAALFKYKLYDRFWNSLNNFNIVTVAPTTIKKFAGGGKMNKLELWEAFKSNNLNDGLLAKSELWKFCKGLETGKKIPKPLDDLVDAYYLSKYIEGLSL